MSIWFKPVTIEELAHSRINTIIDHIGITFTEIGDNYLRATMPVDHRTCQPMRILHGGASCVLAETLASVAACYCVDPETKVCVGLEINTSHVKMAKSGIVTGTARPLHLGRSTQLWEIDIKNEKDELISQSRLRLAVLDRP